MFRETKIEEGFYKLTPTGNSKIYYYVNTKKRTIVACMDGCRNDATRTLMGLAKKSGYVVLTADANDIQMPNSFRGKVRFEEDETFDLDLGMEIARKRMLKKYYLSTRKMIELVIDKTEQALENAHYAHWATEKSLSKFS